MKAGKQVNFTLEQSTGDSSQDPKSSATEAKMEKCVIFLRAVFWKALYIIKHGGCDEIIAELHYSSIRVLTQLGILGNFYIPHK